jgi:hypothetical protein
LEKNNISQNKGRFIMSKHKQLPAITAAAGLAGKAIARLETEARAVHSAESARRLQLVSAGGTFSALIKHGKTTIQIEGNDFAVSTAE